jgi:hypothetical protein
METIHRSELPQLKGELFLTDGGLETTLIFHRGIDLPEFAAFDLLKDDAGTAELRRYFEPYLELARDSRTGFVLESPDLAGEPPLGRRDRLLPGAARPVQPGGDLADGGAPR